MPKDIELARCTYSSFAKNSLDTASQYRFKPATTADGRPVPVRIHIEINYRIEGGSNPIIPIHYSFSSPPGLNSSEPGADGVYPLTKLVTPPSMTSFFDEGFGGLAFSSVGKGVCDVVFTISAKGKPSDPQVILCESPTLEQPAVQSILKSRYKPAKFSGKTVPVRASIKIELGDFASN
jgi:hypothetical protein